MSQCFQRLPAAEAPVSEKVSICCKGLIKHGFVVWIFFTRVENIVAKEKLLIIIKFSFDHNVFKSVLQQIEVR